MHGTSHEFGNARSPGVAPSFPAQDEYPRYIERLDLDNFDADEHDRVFADYLDSVGRTIRKHPDGEGFLDQLAATLARFFAGLPAVAEVLAIGLFLVTAGLLLAGPGNGVGAERAALVAGIASSITASLVVISHGIYRWRVSFRRDRLRASMKDIRQFNYAVVSSQVGQARKSALAYAQRQPADEGPVNLLRLVLLSRMHWELVRMLPLQFRLFLVNMIETPLEDEVWKLRVRFWVVFALTGASVAIFPLLTETDRPGWPVAGVVPLAAIGLGSGFFARFVTFAVFKRPCERMAGRHGFLFEPDLPDKFPVAGLEALRRSGLTWERRTETGDLHRYCTWLRTAIKDLDQRGRPPVISRMARAAKPLNGTAD